MRRSRRRALALVVWAVAGLVWSAAGPSSAAHAVAPDQVAWWWYLQQLPSPAVLPAPNVPEGGMMVSAGPAGVLAFGAVHYTVDAGSAGSLVLRTATGSLATAADMQACPTIKAWNVQAGAGPWFARPSYESDGCAPGEVAADGMSVTFALPAAMSAADAFDVAIVPTAAAKAFSVTFAPPADDSLTVVPPAIVEPPPPVTDPPPVTTPPALDPGTGAANPVGGSDFGSSGGGVVTGTPATSPLPSGDQAAPPVSAPQVSPSDVPRAVRPVAVRVPDGRGQRAMAFVLLLGMLGAWWWFGGKPVAAPRRIGSSAAGGVPVPVPVTGASGGIGRFRTPRSGRPTRL